jgi:hypothetical protein
MILPLVVEKIGGAFSRAQLLKRVPADRFQEVVLVTAHAPVLPG